MGGNMSLWALLEISLFVFSFGALFYLGFDVSRASIFVRYCQKRAMALGAAFVLVSVFFFSLIWAFDFMNAVLCLFYVCAIWGICRFFAYLLQKMFHLKFNTNYVILTAVVLSCVYLLNAWYQAHHVNATHYSLSTSKSISDLRLLLIADAHVGTTFDGKSFQKHVETMQRYHPDLVVIVGDFVDNDTSYDDFSAALEALSTLKSRYGTYFVLGNHDISSNGKAFRGFSNEELLDMFEKSGISVLQDEAKLFDDEFYLIGRKDAFEPRRGRYRKSMTDLLHGLEQNKFLIVLDHQPNDYQNQTEAKVDLVLSGHTHGGQIFPFNNLGKWLGFNDAIYGYERHGKTDFIVTSGISDWRLKFKTGCRSEFVVIDISSHNS